MERSPLNWESVASSRTDFRRTYKSIYSPAQMFSLIFNGKWPNKGQEYLKYMFNVRLVASRGSGTGWAAYDEQYRLYYRTWREGPLRNLNICVHEVEKSLSFYPFGNVKTVRISSFAKTILFVICGPTRTWSPWGRKAYIKHVFQIFLAFVRPFFEHNTHEYHKGRCPYMYVGNNCDF
jgi:hypothetical protein